MKKVTMKDIAALFGVSTHTVAKALNNRPGISEELRQKIKVKARELNYVPNIFGRGLLGKPTKTIGLIVSDNANPAYSLVVKGVEQQAAEFGYTIILGNSNEDPATEKKLLYVLLEKQVDGVLIIPADLPETVQNIQILQQHGTPYMLIARTIKGHQHPCIKADNVRAGYLAGQYLAQKGHARILYLTRTRSISVVEERARGLQQAFFDADISLPQTNIYRRCDVSIVSGYTEMLHILKARRDFTAVAAYNDTIAFGVMMALHECRVRIPSDVAVIGFDNLVFSQACLVPLTTIDQHLYAFGTTATNCLLNTINGHPEASCPEMPEPSLIERQSV